MINKFAKYYKKTLKQNFHVGGACKLCGGTGNIRTCPHNPANAHRKAQLIAQGKHLLLPLSRVPPPKDKTVSPKARVSTPIHRSTVV